MMALHSTWFQARPALLSQATAEVISARQNVLEVSSERRELHGSSAQAVCTFARFDGVDRSLGATVVFMNAP